MGSITERISCRQVLNFMVILGFMFNYMLRVNLTIAIVEMVKINTSELIHHHVAPSSSGELNGNYLNDSYDFTTDIAVTEDSTLEVESSTHHPIIPIYEAEERFEWDARIQNLLLGCFFWGYILTELPGGRLAEVFGARRVFGYSMLAASIITLLTPVSARIGYVAVMILRVLLGFMLGATWPAMHPMAAAWIPPNERSKFISNMMASSLGAAITMPVCGFLIAIFGWPSVFYATGIVGLVWSILWFRVVFDTPALHPRISPQERQYIEDAIAATGNQNNKPERVPWGAMLTSRHVWAIIITHGCSVFGYFTVVNQLPTYMKTILHYNIKANGLFSSLPYLGKYLFAVITSILADHLRSTGKWSTTLTRKVFTTFAVGAPGLLMIMQAYLGQNAAWSVSIFTAALTINGAVTAGYLGNGLDIAPNFSGTIFGLANTLSSLGGFLSAYMVGTLTYNNQSYGQWQIVFWILCVIYIFGAAVFLMFGTGELQKWNNGPVREKSIKGVENGTKAVEEAVPLKENKV